MPRSRSKPDGISIPSTVKRSPAKARRTYAKAKRSAEQTYGSGERAARTAMAALKRGFEKVGDHWEPKDHKGPSDEHARRRSRRADGRSAGGVDMLGHTRDELYARARKLGVRGASRMNKLQLGKAIAAHQ
ncbi:MAG: ChaB family protein [Pseudomonadota bacterium]|nr:ChaB family protein [Pseudomonadota bacterium]